MDYRAFVSDFSLLAAILLLSGVIVAAALGVLPQVLVSVKLFIVALIAIFAANVKDPSIDLRNPIRAFGLCVLTAAIYCAFATPEQQHQALSIVISRIVAVGVMPVGCFGLIQTLIHRIQQRDDFFRLTEIRVAWQAV